MYRQEREGGVVEKVERGREGERERERGGGGGGEGRERGNTISTSDIQYSSAER